MKIIYMNCNYKKSIKKEERKRSMGIASAIIDTLRNKDEISNLSEKQFDLRFKKATEEFDNFSDADLKKIYFDFLITEKKCKGLAKKEIALTSMNEAVITNNIDEKTYSGMELMIRKVTDRLYKVVTNKNVKRIALLATTIVLGILSYLSSNVAVNCATGGGCAITVDKAYAYIKGIAGVVCFLCMTVEIVQSALHGDVRVIWYIVAKYLAILVAFLSFRKIYDIIDGVFNS